MKKRHHYIPQWYLKGFCDTQTPPKHEPYLWVRGFDEDTVKRRGPGNLAAETGYYKCDGPDADQLENDLSAIESRAAFALRSHLGQPLGSRGSIPRDLGTFLAWLAARVPAFRRVVEDGWVDFLCTAKWGQDDMPQANEYRVSLKHLHTGEWRSETLDIAVPMLRSGDWLATLEQQQYVELIRLQAWYFDSNHLPTLSWILLTAPPGHYFLTSDRPLVWFIPGQGFADSPATLKHPDVEVTVPFDQRHALLGIPRQALPPLSVAPSQINVRTACFAERFVGAPTPAVIEETFEALSSFPLITMRP